MWDGAWTVKMPTACAPIVDVATALLSAQQTVGAREDAANAPAPTAAAPRPVAPAPTTAAPRPVAPAPAPVSVYYSNCTAKAAGAGPLCRGDAGYRSGLDRDKDGMACE
ncbi:MAG: Excalibur domain protein [Jatrophihabitantaceae bacterium]|nr:Excalibur domain protein [Jatrophihabitantaceae bacterium]